MIPQKKSSPGLVLEEVHRDTATQVLFIEDMFQILHGAHLH